MFPDTNTTWQAVFEGQKLILKNAGKGYAPRSCCVACRAALVTRVGTFLRFRG